MGAPEAMVFYVKFVPELLWGLKRGARLRWQSQPRQLGGLTRLRGCRAEKNYGQVSAGIEIVFSVSH